MDNEPRSDIADAAKDFASAYRVWFEDATGLLTGEAVDTALDEAELAMENGLLAITPDPDNGATVLVSSLGDFWEVISISAPLLYTTALGITPPPVAGIPALILALGLVTDVDGLISTSDAALQLGGAIHTGSLGGLWHLPVGATAAIL
ncbi:MAG: hypothetical protein GY814_03600 [Gammaproteobacteria bacterium]|nr:hypothetical protein [Gammaproteobacteria bacterium]